MKEQQTAIANRLFAFHGEVNKLISIAVQAVMSGKSVPETIMKLDGALTAEWDNTKQAIWLSRGENS